MTNINLLPWREQLREEQKRQFFAFLGGAVVIGGLVVLCVHLFISQKIDTQYARNAFLKIEISRLDRKITEIKSLKEKKEELIERMAIIQELQSSRPASVALINELVRVVPDGVYLNMIDRAGKWITISGKAESNTQVSELMREIESAPGIDKPILQEIKTPKQGEGRYSDFRLQLINSSLPMREE